MNYDISKATAPAMPNLGKGTECLKLLLSQASKDMHEPLVPMLFPSLGAHISGSEFQYPNHDWMEPTGMMANLVAHSGDNKSQLTTLAKAICRDFSQHDEGEEKKYLAWQRQKNTRGANKDKPEEPMVAYWFPPSDTTKPAFLKNAMALEAQGGRSQYFNLPEVEMADQLCGSHKQLSVMLRNIYDRAKAGALRATADGVTGNPILRACITISSTPTSTRKFYKHELFNGTFGRMVFSYKPRTSRSGRIPRIGKFDDAFCQKLDEYLMRLDLCKGRFIIRPLNKLTDRLAEDMASLADLADDDLLFEMSHRSLVSAWKAGCVLWVLNNQTWTKAMGELVECWSTTTSGARCSFSATCSAKMPTNLMSLSVAARRICSTACRTFSTSLSWKRSAPASARVRRVPVDNCANGCTASSSPTRTRRGCIRKRRST